MEIETTAKIKKCVIKPECADVAFDGFNLTSNQYKQVATWLKGKDELIVIIKPAQNNLPGIDEGENNEGKDEDED